MGHQHHHPSPTSFTRAFAVGIALNTGFVLLEVGFGFYAQSLALLADAGHNLSDVLGLILAWGAIALSQRRPTQRRTYGLRRSTILAALGNAVLLLVVVGGISWEAIRRVFYPEPPREIFIVAVAAAGFIINGATAILFFRGRSHDVNVRGAFLHMAADAAVSLGVVAGGIVMVFTHWGWIDSALSLVIALVILTGTWELLRESLDLALDAVPKGIEPHEVESYLRSISGVTEVHDLHIWGLSTTEAALTAHLVMPEATSEDAFLREVTRELHERFGIEHATLQIERGNLADYPCGTPCSTGDGAP